MRSWTCYRERVLCPIYDIGDGGRVCVNIASNFLGNKRFRAQGRVSLTSAMCDSLWTAARAAHAIYDSHVIVRLSAPPRPL